MGSRVADEALVGNFARGDGAEKLDLFAAHNIETFATERNAGDDDDVLADPDKASGQLVEPCGARHVGSFDPAAVRPDHSAEDHRRMAQPLTDFGESAFELTAPDGQNPAAVLEFTLAATIGAASSSSCVPP